MIQLLINISPEAAEVIRCDGLVDKIQIPLEKTKQNPKLGIACSTTNLIAVIQTVTEVCREATEQSEMLRRMAKIEELLAEKT